MSAEVRKNTKSTGLKSATVAVGVTVAEVVGLVVIFFVLLSFSVQSVVWLSLIIFLVSMFVLITGRPAPRIHSRLKGFVIAFLSSVFLMASATIHQEQREEYLAELRSKDVDAFLSELQRTDQDRWLAELETLRPEQFHAELLRQEKEAQAERKRKCSDRKLGEAYVMIQNDVRMRLRSPATADFPARFSIGTRNEGDCIYRVVGHVDAQNGFGALIRSSFEGRIAYFPESGSWRTLELAVGG